MTLRQLCKPVIAACLLGTAGLGGAHAATLTEDFEAPFPAWESGWFGTHSDANNYYCGGTRGCADRGNNPDGLWLSSLAGGGSLGNIVVTFDATFGASLTSLKLDVASYTLIRLTALDSAGTVVFDEEVTQTFGAETEPGVYASFTITSANGIGGFSLVGNAAGFTSIDNLVAATVPEPASVALMLAGLAAVGAAARRRVTARG